MKVRLWLFTPRPMGDPRVNPDNLNYPEGGTYDTSVFDSVIKKCSDPEQFLSFETMLAYANAHDESLQQVANAAEAFAFCSPKQVTPPGTPPVVVVPPPTTTLPPPGSTGTPVDPNAKNWIPNGTVPPDNTTTQGVRFMQGTVYRLILAFSPGRVDTGATYPMCSRSNPDACQPVQFQTVEDAIAYAKAHNEIPVRVADENEAWAIIDGSVPIHESNIMTGGGFFDNLSPMEIVAGLLGLVFVVPKLFKRGA